MANTKAAPDAEKKSANAKASDSPAKKKRKKSAGKRSLTASNDGNSGDAVDVKKLRADLGNHFGTKSYSRAQLSEVVGVSALTLAAWETNKALTASSKKAASLRVLAKRVASGDFNGIAEPKRRGRARTKRGGMRSPADPSPRIKKTGRGRAPAPKPTPTNGLSRDVLVRELAGRARQASDPGPFLAVIELLMGQS